MLNMQNIQHILLQHLGICIMYENIFQFVSQRKEHMCVCIYVNIISYIFIAKQNEGRYFLKIKLKILFIFNHWKNTRMTLIR